MASNLIIIFTVLIMGILDLVTGKTLISKNKFNLKILLT